MDGIISTHHSFPATALVPLRTCLPPCLPASTIGLCGSPLSGFTSAHPDHLPLHAVTPPSTSKILNIVIITYLRFTGTPSEPVSSHYSDSKSPCPTHQSICLFASRHEVPSFTASQYLVVLQVTLLLIVTF